MLISTALVSGFQREIRQKVFGYMGHIQINRYDRNFSFESSSIDKRQPFYQKLKSYEGVRHIQQYITKPGIIKTDDQIEGVVLKGIGFDFDRSFLEKHLIEGNVFQLSADSVSFDILISRSTARRMNVKQGDELFINFIDPETLRVRSRKFSISGIYNTGLEEFDRLFAVVDLRQIQKLNNWSENEIGGFEVFVEDMDDLERLNAEIYQMLDPDLNSRTIKNLQPNIFDWLELQTINEQIILALMVIVAIINMITALLILILERTNMIGLLKSVGADNWLIRRIFIYNSGYILLMGLFWGNLIGIGLCLLQRYYGLITLPEATYYVSEAPVHLDIPTFLLINFATLIICSAVMLAPSWLVSKIRPVKALRFE